MYEVIVIGAMIAVNSVFAGFEIALASVSAGHLDTLAREKRRGAAAAVRMKHKMEASLAVVQLGITLVGAVAAATGGAGAAESIEPMLVRQGLSPRLADVVAIVLVVAPLTVVTIVLGELVPKVFALRNRDWVCLTLSPAMEWFSFSMWPAVWFLESAVSLIMSLGDWGRKPGPDSAGATAREELHGAAAGARMARLIGQREEGIIVSASRLAVTPLRQIMLPAEYIGMIPADMSLADALIAAHREMHTRYPVTEQQGDPQRIIGYVNFKDIVAALRLSPHDPSLRSLIRRIHNFDAEMSVADALEHLIRDRNHIAVLRDDAGKVVGMITLEDVVEELVGEIHDEFDRMPSHLTPAGRGWIAGGFVDLKQLRAVAGIDLKPLSEKPVYTLNDWVVERLDGPPRGGDVVTDDDCRVLIRKTRQTLVQEAFLTPQEPQAADSREASE